MQNEVGDGSFLCKWGNVITCHWFLIILSQVHQIPQSWVELFHNILEEQETRLIF